MFNPMFDKNQSDEVKAKLFRELEEELFGPALNDGLQNNSDTKPCSISLSSQKMNCQVPLSNGLFTSVRTPETQSNIEMIEDVQFIKKDNLTEDDLHDLETQLFAQYEQDDQLEVESDLIDCDSDDDDESDNELNQKFSDHCNLCHDVPKKAHKSTDEQLKDRVFDMPISHLASCNPQYCRYGGGCVDKTTIADTRAMHEELWGVEGGHAPSTTERRAKYIEILRVWHLPEQLKKESEKYYPFTFFAGQRDRNNRQICEGAFLVLSGISLSPNASQAPTQWRNAKQYVLNGGDQDVNKYFSDQSTADKFKLHNERVRRKFENAVVFIRYFTKLFGDTVPSATGGDKTVYIVPFSDIRTFHSEYKYYNASHQIPSDLTAKLTIFQDAYRFLKSEGYRKLKCKGSFNTCEICNNATDLLRNKSKKLNGPQREIIQKFRQLHLSQQSKEREYLEERKLKAAELDEFGQPLRMLLFVDGMTQFTTQTPKFPNPSKGDRTVESRIVAVEVYCGEIRTVFVYRIDGLIPMGANIMIEVMRQAIIDLCLKLRALGKKTPDSLWLQFDNCGENKNKEMFSYISLLVETFKFKESEICFLIVGHTHASIDQYFSVISKAIKKAKFIGSPLALMEIIRRAHNASWVQEPVVRDLVVYYDVVSALAPYINMKIKHYQIPHHFLIERMCGGIAIMKYKMFCTNGLYLPIPTAGVDRGDAVLERQIDHVVVADSLAVIDGPDRLMTRLGYKQHETPKEVLKDVISTSVCDHLEKLMPDLEKLSVASVSHEEVRMSVEADGDDLQTMIETEDYRKECQRRRATILSDFAKLSDKSTGFIVWLNQSARKASCDDLMPVCSLKPMPFNPREILSNEKLRKLEDETEAKAREYGNELLSPHIDRPVSSKPGRHCSDPYARKLLNGATAIASAAKWVIDNIGSRIAISGADFDPDENFASLSINVRELEFYRQRDTVDKVIDLASSAYANAPEWSPLPQCVLSDSDLERIAFEESEHLKRLKVAEALAKRLLVRPGHNLGEKDEVIPRTADNTLISEQLRIKRKSNADSEQSKRSKSGNDRVVHYFCDVNECDSIAISAIKICQKRPCVKYRFCELHKAHESHMHQAMREHRTEYSVVVSTSSAAVMDTTQDTTVDTTTSSTVSTTIAAAVASTLADSSFVTVTACAPPVTAVSSDDVTMSTSPVDNVQSVVASNTVISTAIVPYVQRSSVNVVAADNNGFAPVNVPCLNVTSDQSIEGVYMGGTDQNAQSVTQDGSLPYVPSLGEHNILDLISAICGEVNRKPGGLSFTEKVKLQLGFKVYCVDLMNLVEKMFKFRMTCVMDKWSTKNWEKYLTEFGEMYTSVYLKKDDHM